MKYNKRSKIPEINVTPLVDVMLVLLVIFMAVLPSLHNRVDVQLPKITYSKSKPENCNDYICISISATKISINNTALSLEQVQQELKLKKNENKKVVIEADKNLRYEVLFALLDAIKAAGICEIGLIGIQEEKCMAKM